VSVPPGWSEPLARRLWEWLQSRGIDAEPRPESAVAAFALAYDDGSAANGQIEVRPAEAQIVVYLDAPWAVPPDRWSEVAGVIARLNWALPVGNLELNRAGDLRCRTSVDLEGVDLDPGSFDELMESLVGACHVVLHDALEPVAAVIDGDDPGPLP
jgi:hypothetical protein